MIVCLRANNNGLAALSQFGIAPAGTLFIAER
jgi:hypothetical protein